MSKQIEVIGAIELAGLLGQSRQAVGWKARRGQIPGMIGSRSLARPHRGHGYEFNLAEPKLQRWIAANRIDKSEPRGRAGRKPNSARKTVKQVVDELPKELRGTGFDDFIFSLRRANAAVKRKLSRLMPMLNKKQRLKIHRTLEPLVDVFLLD